MAQSLTCNIAAVTGAASGIGLATTRALLDAGARVVMVDRNKAALAGLAAELGENAVPQITDLLDVESCAAMIPDILNKVDHIDILHCNAGSYIGGDLAQTDGSTIDRMLNVNINAVMKNVRDVIPHMTGRGTGDILVTCSVAGHIPVHWEPVYSASKWAINSFVQTMRRQLNTSGVRVAQISPGPTASNLLADWPEQSLLEAGETGSLMEPEDIAEAVIFMLTRPRNVTIRDMIILPTNFDI